MLQQVEVGQYVKVVDYQDEGNAVPGEDCLLPAQSGFILLDDKEMGLFLYLKQEMTDKGLLDV